MPYSINIFDKNDLNAATVFEFAQRSTLRLNYAGGDDKMLNIIGSDLSFTMEVTDFSDAFFKHLYTYDERRYWVTMNNADTGELIWQGFLLPEQYDEPYTSGAFFVKFVAADGLGALKFQYLPDDLYEKEITISQAVAQCLKLTGLVADIFVCPAITNVSGKRWDEMYIDARKYVNDKGEKEHAYSILSEILADSLCCIFQENGNWYVYGFNKRTLLAGEYWQFDDQGIFKQIVPFQKAVLNNTFLGVPRIRVNTPRRVIEARHDLVDNAIDESTYKITNPGYALAVPLDLFNQKWAFTDIDFRPKFNSNNGRVFLDAFEAVHNPNDHIQIRRELLLIAGEKVQWDFEFKSEYSGGFASGKTVDQLFIDGDWDKIVVYDIFYTDPATGNEVLLYSNQNGATAGDARYQIKFDRDRNAALSIQMIAPATAYYNIRFYRLFTNGVDIKTDKVFINKLSLSVIASDDEKIYRDEIPQAYTQGIDVQLGMHDDLKDFDNIIRLDRLGPTGAQYYQLNLNGIPTFERDGKHYLAVQLSTALYVQEHPETVYMNGDNIRVIDVVFDFPNNFEYAIEYDADLLGRVIITENEGMVVQLRKFAEIPSNLPEWVQWADDVYQNSYKRYGAAVVEVLRNLYQTPHPRISANVQGFVFMRDLINFNYDGPKVFYPTDVSIALDDNITSLQLSQNMYGQAVTDNLPPVVDAGPDLVLSAAASGVNLNAIASDPDGFIASVLWELVSGTGNPIIANPDQLNTSVSGLTGDHYVFRVTVTDDSGLTASDEVVVSRATAHNVVVTYLVNSNNKNLPEPKNYVYQNLVVDLKLNPNIPAGVRVRFRLAIIAEKETPINIGGAKPNVVILITKRRYDGGQGAIIAQQFEAGSFVFDIEIDNETYIQMSLNTNSRNTSVYGQSAYPELVPGTVRSFLQADVTAEVVAGAAVITGLPLQFISEAIQ